MSLSTLAFRERPGVRQSLPDDEPAVIIDYVIDGLWFAEALAERGVGPKAPNIAWGWNGVHSPFGTGDRQQQLDRANCFLPGVGSQFGPHRAGVLFCSQCSDEYCGLESVSISESEGIVTWSGMSKTWFEFFLMGDDRDGDGIWHNELALPEVVFRFDAKQYREAIDSLLALIETMEPWPKPDDYWPRLSS